jgi:hypothetical protein
MNRATEEVYAELLTRARPARASPARTRRHPDPGAPGTRRMSHAGPQLRPGDTEVMDMNHYGARG